MLHGPALSTYMRSHPDYGVESRFLVTVNRLVRGGEVRILKELAAISAESLDVLVVCLAQLPLETPVHGPVPAEGALLVINPAGWSHSWSSTSRHSTSTRGDGRTSNTSTTSTTWLTPTIQPLPHLFWL